jgi:hypothetical protein
MNRRSAGLTILASSILVLFILPLWMAVQPPPPLAAFKIAFMAQAAGSVVLIFAIALFLLGRGLLLKTPMRVYKEGLLIQPLLSTMPSIVAYAGISSIELWDSARGRKTRSGCTILSREGKRITSVEMFRDKNQAKEFVGRISPAIEAAGFTAHSEDDGLLVAFRRDSLTNFPAASQ